MASASALERELLAITAKYDADEDPVDVLEALSQHARLLAATAKLRRLMHRDAASAGGADGLFELRPREKDGVVALVGEGGQMARRIRVREYEDVRLLDGTTTIRAQVELQPLPPPLMEEGHEAGAGGAGSKKWKGKRLRPCGVEGGEAVRLHFHFTRRPGPKRGSSMPYAAQEEEGMLMMEEEEEEGSDDGSASSSSSSSCSSDEGPGSIASETAAAAAGCCGGGGGGGEDHHHHHHHHHAAPTTIVEYSIAVSPSIAEPPVEILHAVIYGLHPSGAPSPRGIRGPEGGEEEDEEEDGEGGGGKEPRDLGLVELDDEALQAARAWCCGPDPAWGEAEFLSFLLFFPYYEEEFDVPGLVMDQIFGGEEEEEEEEEEEAAAPLVRVQPVPSPQATKGGKKKDRGEEKGKKRHHQGAGGGDKQKQPSSSPRKRPRQ
jgi:hypothetical protein